MNNDKYADLNNNIYKVLNKFLNKNPDYFKAKNNINENTTKMREIQNFITDIINVVLDDNKKKLK